MNPPEIDHIAIAVNSIEESCGFFKDVMNLEFEKTEEVPGQSVRVGFFRVGDAYVELVEPTGDASPVRKFLDKRGPGMHHLAFRVADLEAVLAELKEKGVRMINETPRDGTHGFKVAFVHPESTGGVLVEFRQRV